MVAIFAIFATLSSKQAGVGMAAAVLIDATVIRAVLLPASMTILGEWSWYLPHWLDWLPRLQIDETAGEHAQRRTSYPLGEAWGAGATVPEGGAE